MSFKWGVVCLKDWFEEKFIKKIEAYGYNLCRHIEFGCKFWWGYETLIYNICYDLSLLDKDKNYALKEILKFNKALQILFEVYLAKYDSTTIHDMMRNLETSASATHDNKESIWL